MSFNPLVSVIIPTYNRSAYILEAISSILNQTYENLECLIIDDGSTDNTEELVLNLTKEDDRVKYHKRPDGFAKGSNGSRNFGLSLAKGSLLAFCDDDDYWLLDKLEKQVPIFDQHPEVGLVTGNIEFVKKNGIRTGRVITQTNNHGYVFEDFLLKNRISMITPVIRKEVFDKVGWFNTDFKIFEDWECWRRIAYYYPFYALKDVLACVRKHDTNTSLIVTQNPIEQYYRYKKLNKALLKWGKERFTKSDFKLIEKVSFLRYKQLLGNHCPGVINKLKFFFAIFRKDRKDGYELIRLFSSYSKIG